MLDPRPGKQYWFVRLPSPEDESRLDEDRPTGERAEGSAIEVMPFIRHHDDSTGLTFKGMTIVYENHPGVYLRALEVLYASGFLELEEAKTAGALPADWEVSQEIQDRHPWVEPRERYRRARERNLVYQEYARSEPACPRCGNREPGTIRFLDQIPRMDSAYEQGFMSIVESCFICNRCARSFRLEDLGYSGA